MLTVRQQLALARVNSGLLMLFPVSLNASCITLLFAWEEVLIWRLHSHVIIISTAERCS